MKQALMSLIVISSILLIASAGTYAYFSDTETVVGNTFSAGTFNLQIKDNDEPWRDGVPVTATWTATNMKPGQAYPFDVPMINLWNDGTVQADHLEISVDYTVNEENPRSEADTDPHTDLHPDTMAKYIIVTKCQYWDSSGVNCLTDPDLKKRITDTDGDGKITFYDFKNHPLDNLPKIANGGMGGFQMSTKFDEDAGNDFQGDTFNLNMYFTLNQDASQ